MTWKELYAQIKEGAVQSLYLFSGPEEFLKRDALEALRRALLPAGLEQLNDATLEGASAQDIIDAAETLPLMCERRIVTVRDWPALMSGRARNEEEDVSRMLDWLRDVPTTCTLVFWMRGEPDGRKKLTAALKKRGAEVRFDPLADADILRWALSRLKPLGKKISREAASRLTFTAGRDLTRLSGEIDKLADYVGEREQIEAEDVDAVVSPSPEYSVFEMLDMLFEGDIARAEESLHTLLMGGQTYVGVLALVIRQLRMLSHMALALREGRGTQEVEKALKLHPYAAKRASRQARTLDADQLARLYDQCVEADFQIKSGKLRDREALHAAMLRIADLRAGGNRARGQSV